MLFIHFRMALYTPLGQQNWIKITISWFTPNITLNEDPRDTSLFLVLTALKRPLKKQASHQNAELISLANLVNYEI